MTKREISAILTALLLMFVVPASALAETAAGSVAKRPASLADRSRVQVPGSPKISPDGQEIVFELDGRIFLTTVDERSPMPLSPESGTAWNPQWSADGRTLFFNSDRGGVNQFWKLPMDRDGEAMAATSIEKGASSGKLAPDELSIVLSFTSSELSGDDKKADAVPFVIDRRQFKHDAGSGYLTEDQIEHLYRYDVRTGQLERLTQGNFAESGASWAPDSSSVVFVSSRDAGGKFDYRSDIWLADASGAARKSHLRRLTNDAKAKYSPSFSPDGSVVAYIASDDNVYGIQHIQIVATTGGTPRNLTGELDRWVTSFQFSADSKWIYFDYDDAGSRHLARIHLRNGKIETLVDGDVNVSSFSTSRSGALAIAMNNRNDVTEIYRLDDGHLQKLTNLNDSFFAELQVGDKTKISFPSEDGTRVEAFVTMPHDFAEGQRYPTVLKMHGGPVDQFSWGYDFGTQYLAANGYVVIEPNPRGSTGHGQEFVRAIYRSWGISDYQDVIAAIDFAIDSGYADPQQLAVTGYSYGGYMTNVVITNTTRFKAAAAGAGHSLIAANVGHDMYQQWYSWELGLPWENRDLYDKMSPLLRAGNVTTPTLFLGGREDWNVPILSSELFYQALKMKGVDTRLIVYPDSHHGDWSQDFEQDYLRRVVAWFDRYVKTD